MNLQNDLIVGDMVTFMVTLVSCSRYLKGGLQECCVGSLLITGVVIRSKQLTEINLLKYKYKRTKYSMTLWRFFF